MKIKWIRILATEVLKTLNSLNPNFMKTFSTLYNMLRMEQTIYMLRTLVQNDMYVLDSLTLSWRRPLSYRNQSIDLKSKSMKWFQYDKDLLRHKRVNYKNQRFLPEAQVLLILKWITCWYYSWLVLILLDVKSSSILIYSF